MLLLKEYSKPHVWCASKKRVQLCRCLAWDRWRCSKGKTTKTDLLQCSAADMLSLQEQISQRVQRRPRLLTITITSHHRRHLTTITSPLTVSSFCDHSSVISWMNNLLTTHSYAPVPLLSNRNARRRTGGNLGSVWVWRSALILPLEKVWPSRSLAQRGSQDLEESRTGEKHGLYILVEAIGVCLL